jgi:prepilin-type N-terminal cleavage/methylation domain-containing protein
MLILNQVQQIQRASRRPADPITAGFTLVEVLAAVVLLSVGLLAILTASEAARDAQRRALYISAGRDIAQSKMEWVRCEKHYRVDGYTESGTDPSLPAGNSVKLVVSRYPDPYQEETDMFRAVVTVTWPEGKGNRTISYDSLFYKP